MRRFKITDTSPGVDHWNNILVHCSWQTTVIVDFTLYIRFSVLIMYLNIYFATCVTQINIRLFINWMSCSNNICCLPLCDIWAKRLHCHCKEVSFHLFPNENEKEAETKLCIKFMNVLYSAVDFPWSLWSYKSKSSMKRIEMCVI